MPTRELKENYMNHYRSSTPRVALGFAAFAMTVVTMGALVVLPASLESTTATFDLMGAAAAAIPRASNPQALCTSRN
jgi:hypothetical protein